MPGNPLARGLQHARPAQRALLHCKPQGRMKAERISRRHEETGLAIQRLLHAHEGRGNDRQAHRHRLLHDQRSRIARAIRRNLEGRDEREITRTVLHQPLRRLRAQKLHFPQPRSLRLSRERLTQRAIAYNIERRALIRRHQCQRGDEIINALLCNKAADEKQTPIGRGLIAETKPVRINPARHFHEPCGGGNHRDVPREITADRNHEIGARELQRQILRLGIDIMSMAHEGACDPREARRHQRMGCRTTSEMRMHMVDPALAEKARDTERLVEQRGTRQALLHHHEFQRTGQPSNGRPKHRLEAIRQITKLISRLREQAILRLGKALAQAHQQRQHLMTFLAHGPDFVADEGFRENRKIREEIGKALHDEWSRRKGRSAGMRHGISKAGASRQNDRHSQEAFSMRAEFHDARVSVVIPNRNNFDTLPAALASVEAQQVPGTEIIVVDDGSTDGAREWLYRASQKNPFLRVLHTGGVGPSGARNEAISIASAPIIAFLDSDDIWERGKLRVQVDYMERNPEVGFTFTDYRHFGPTGDDRGTCFEYWKSEFRAQPPSHFFRVEEAEATLLAVNLVGTSTVAARKTLLQNANGFATRLASAEDWDLWLRLAAMAPVAATSMVAMRYLMRPNSLTAQRDKRLLAISDILDRYRDHENPALRKAWRQGRARILRAKAEIARAEGRRMRAASDELRAFFIAPEVNKLRAATADLVRSVHAPRDAGAARV